MPLNLVDRPCPKAGKSRQEKGGTVKKHNLKWGGQRKFASLPVIFQRWSKERKL